MPNLNEPSMTSNRSYLLRAFYEWIVDNHLTPYVVINTGYSEVVVPRQYIENEQIILNVSPMAVNNLFIDQHCLTFHARFSSQLMKINAPIAAVLAIYARENGRGMIFQEETGALPPPTPSAPATSDADSSGSDKDSFATLAVKGKKGKPNLRVIK